MSFGAVYYTDNTADEAIYRACRKQLLKCLEQWKIPLISVSQKPIDNFGKNIVMNLERSVLSMFKQILRGIKECKTDYIFLIEHDVLYDLSHFNFIPPRKNVFYYNRNMWHLSAETGKTVYYLHNDPSHLCASRNLLLKHYQRVVREVSTNGFSGSYGFSPPKGLPKQMRVGRYATYMSEKPNIDIRHKNAFTRQRMDKSQFRSDNSCREWTESDGVPYWGKTLGRFDEFLASI